MTASSTIESIDDRPMKNNWPSGSERISAGYEGPYTECYPAVGDASLHWTAERGVRNWSWSDTNDQSARFSLVHGFGSRQDLHEEHGSTVRHSWPYVAAGTLPIQTLPQWDVEASYLVHTLSKQEIALSIIIAPVSELGAALHPVVQEFADGVEGVVPVGDAVDMAVRLVRTAVGRLIEPEFSVDVDGALFFDLRLTNGLLLFAELSPGGTLDVRVYDDSNARAELKTVHRWPHATEEDFISLL